jgi:hypothetical protein
MDKSQLITIVISTLTGVIAKDFMAWLLATIKNLSIVVTFKAKLSAFFTKSNLAIFGDILALLFYSALLIKFARDPSPLTRLTILLAIGLVFGVLAFTLSLLFKFSRFQAQRAKNHTQLFSE